MGRNPKYKPIGSIKSQMEIFMESTFKLFCIIAIAAITGLLMTACNGLQLRPRSGRLVEMVHIEGGTFAMGSPNTEANRLNDETQRQVTLSGFYIGKYEVTQEQYEAVMGNNPASFTTNADIGENQNRRPVEMVSWYDALAFCNKLSISERLTPAYSINGETNPDKWGAVLTGSSSAVNAIVIVEGSNGYRLPTDAQWEYACRAGTTTAFNNGNAINDDTGWYSRNSGNKTHEVGLKPPNAWGLYDMHGNVLEWCWDWWNGEVQTDPVSSSRFRRMVRGGCWSSPAENLRSAYRFHNLPDYRSSFFGFRLARPESNR
jgi:formylglycine-generating enzyme required for sulfatase activity